MATGIQFNKSRLMTETDNKSSVPILGQSLDNARFRNGVIRGKLSTMHATKTRVDSAGDY